MTNNREDIESQLTRLARMTEGKAGNTPQRSFRIPDDLYTAAQSKAEGEGETVTDVIRRALEGYVAPAVAVDPRDPR